MNPEALETGASLVRDGGSVLIAAVVLAVLIYLGWRFIIRPSQVTQREREEASRATAEAHRSMATELKCAAKLCHATSESNARTAVALEKIADGLLRRQSETDGH